MASPGARVSRGRDSKADVARPVMVCCGNYADPKQAVGEFPFICMSTAGAGSRRQIGG